MIYNFFSKNNTNILYETIIRQHTTFESTPNMMVTFSFFDLKKIIARLRTKLVTRGLTDPFLPDKINYNPIMHQIKYYV